MQSLNACLRVVCVCVWSKSAVVAVKEEYNCLSHILIFSRRERNDVWHTRSQLTLNQVKLYYGLHDACLL